MTTITFTSTPSLNLGSFQAAADQTFRYAIRATDAQGRNLGYVTNASGSKRTFADRRAADKAADAVTVETLSPLNRVAIVNAYRRHEAIAARNES